jgi:TonB family protein
MFDKLIVSEPEGADFKNRSRYFMVSTLVVGVFFATAVVFSIYAAEVGLGNRDFELVSMLAPPDLNPVEAEQHRPERSRTEAQSQSPTITRQVNMARIDEVIREVPNAVSTTQNTQMERPAYGRFDISKVDSGPVSGQTSGRETDGVSPAGSGIAGSPAGDNTEKDKDIELPPVIKKVTPPTRPVSKGVLNGQATSLPKPLYSATAKAVGAQGLVTVQVTIDESGRVISANAVNGHVLLRADSEKAARNARFSPTYLSDIPVKVTGVITYNFVK